MSDCWGVLKATLFALVYVPVFLLATDALLHWTTAPLAVVALIGGVWWVFAVLAALCLFWLMLLAGTVTVCGIEAGIHAVRRTS